MRRRLAQPFGFFGGLVLAVFVAACGGDSAGPSVAVGTATRVTAVPAGALEIDQQDIAFKPQAASAAVGATVYFKNSETAIHTVSVNGKDISGTMKKGEVIAWTPPAAGTFKITCDYHPQMRASITIR